MSKVALITGGASGIGFEFAKIVAADGYNLLLIDINENGLKEACDSLTSEFEVEANYLFEDLSKTQAAANVHSFINQKNLAIHIIFNNAGFGNFGYFKETSLEKDNAMLNVHMITTTNLIKLLLPQMIKRGEGRILNNASVAAFVPGPLMSTYHASKAYLLYLSLALNDELKGTGITVTTLCPGMTRTGFQKANGNETPDIKFNIATAKDVAKYGYKMMMKGKPVAIPGFFNKLSAFLPRFLPRKRVASMVGNIQRKNHAKRMTN